MEPAKLGYINPMNCFRALALLALTASALPALAWDDSGHQLVGIIAYNQLSPAEQAKLNRILNAGEGSFAVPENAPGLGLGKAATFCDYIKRNTNTQYEKEINELNDWAYPQSQRKQGDNESTRMRAWHYKDKAIHTAGKQNHLHDNPFDAVKAIDLANDRFPRESTDRMKCFWVYWLAHVVGDLHQPLHCVSSLQFNPEGDAGGNGFKLSGDPRNLHFLWDSAITDAVSREGWRGGLIEKAVMIQELHPQSEFTAQLKDLNANHWVDEGAILAERIVYVGIEQNSTENSTYRAKRIDLALKQAALAGYRLAAVLKKLLNN